MMVVGCLLYILETLMAHIPVLRTLKIGPHWMDDTFRFGFLQCTFFVLGVACFATTQAVLHHAQGDNIETASPGVATSFSELLVRFIVVPGPFVEVWCDMAYPLVPWLGMSCWGVAMGFEFKYNPDRAFKRALWHGLLLLAAFPLVRFAGGSVLNLRGWPLHEHRK